MAVGVMFLYVHQGGGDTATVTTTMLEETFDCCQHREPDTQPGHLSIRRYLAPHD
jgi:hypothetical protein